MEYFKRIQVAFTSTFINSNVEMFDEDFRQLLQIFYFLGFYLPVPSKKREVFRWVFFLVVFVSFLLGFLKELFVSLNEGNMQKFLIAVPYAALEFTQTTLIITFFVREREIIEMIKAFHSIHEGEDDTPLEYYRKKCVRLVKFYAIALQISVSTSTIFQLLGFGLFKLQVPTLIDDFAEGYLFTPLLLLSILQAHVLTHSAKVTGVLTIPFMVRSGANFEILSNKIRRCADSEDLSENESNLISCIKYHWKIVEQTKKIQNVFSYLFVSRFWGSIVVLTCFFFVVMKSDIQEVPLTVILGIIGLMIAFIQLGSLCIVGQWLTSKSASLLEASYDCNWYNQSKLFKKNFIIFRSVCQREMKTGAPKFDFSHESFYQMISNAYYYYNNMSHSIGSLEK